jgi:hypothetical protein
MLCESLLHILVEEGLLTKVKAIEAIETVAELTHEPAESDPRSPAKSQWTLVEGHRRELHPSRLRAVERVQVSSRGRSPASCNFAHELTTALQVGNRFRRTGVGT